MHELHLKIKTILQGRQPRPIENKAGIYREAAVLIPLFQDGPIHKILFTKRTDLVEAHKGQISFPGGMVDPEDRSLAATALREAQEEIGLRDQDITLLGRTDDMLTLASNFIIHPFVGAIPYPYPFKLNAFEVDSLIQVPLRVFYPSDPPEKMLPVEYEGRQYESLSYDYDGHRIWGATARVMENLIEIIGIKIDLPPGP